MSVNVDIPENKTLAKISKFTVQFLNTSIGQEAVTHMRTYQQLAF